MNRAIIFDLDGTLVDSRHDLACAGNHARAALGLPALSLETVAGYVGDGVEKLIERLVPAADAAARVTATAAFSDHYHAHCTAVTRPYPGIPAMLDELRGRGWMLAVATNKPLRFTLAILDACALDQFTEVRGGDGPRKPDPGQLTSILDELGADPRASWMVGDHRTDILAGRAAGCRVMWCAWGIGRHDGLAVDAVAAAPDRVAGLVDA